MLLHRSALSKEQKLEEPFQIEWKEHKIVYTKFFVLDWTESRELTRGMNLNSQGYVLYHVIPTIPIASHHTKLPISTSGILGSSMFSRLSPFAPFAFFNFLAFFHSLPRPRGHRVVGIEEVVVDSG